MHKIAHSTHVSNKRTWKSYMRHFQRKINVMALEEGLHSRNFWLGLWNGLCKSTRKTGPRNKNANFDRKNEIFATRKKIKKFPKDFKDLFMKTDNGWWKNMAEEENAGRGRWIDNLIVENLFIGFEWLSSANASAHFAHLNRCFFVSSYRFMKRM